MTEHPSNLPPEVFEKLRRAMGLCPPSLEEADAAMRQSKPVVISKEDIESIVRDVVAGRSPDLHLHADEMWSESYTDDFAESREVVLNRPTADTVKERDEEVERDLEERRKRLLEGNSTNEQKPPRVD